MAGEVKAVEIRVQYLDGWQDPPPVREDYLLSYRHLATWAGHVDLITAADVGRLVEHAQRDPGRAAELLMRTRRFRSDLYAVSTNATAAAWDGLCTEAEAAAATARLVPGRPHGRWAITYADAGLALPLLAAAQAAGDLVTSPIIGRIAACPGRRCGWLFINRRGTRRWCVMAGCGNRAKARRFADRRRSLSL